MELDPWTALLWVIFAALAVTAAAWAAGHAAIYKRDSRAAMGWVGLILAVPLIGAALYLVLGVNRIQRQAVARRQDLTRYRTRQSADALPAAKLRDHLKRSDRHLVQLAHLVDGVVDTPRLAGNLIKPLVGGHQAYDAMLAAIHGAERSVALATYIFDNDRAGALFTEALSDAVVRGVEVRVLIDSIGDRYSHPPMRRALQRAGIPAASFMPTFFPRRLPYLNLRNHRKLLVVDGRLAFTGGMNIREGHMTEDNPAEPVQDLHFRVEGPVVSTLREIFAEDWTFSTQELLQGDVWFPKLEPRGEVIANGIADGPDEDLDVLRWTLLGAIGCAQRSIRIVTPYFVPDTTLARALGVAARRGVEVEIFLPERNNLKLVQWASTALLWQVLESGCRLYSTPPPFDHTKLMVVDESWAFFGSANWDTRSLRLNFEFDLECYCCDLAGHLTHLVDTKRSAARPITLTDVDSRSLPVRLRDGFARLLSPYL